MIFRDRTDAGERLAERLATLAPRDPVVLALPRGGVPVALPVARRLAAPLDLLLVRKLGLPGQDELAAGALAEGDPPVTVWNRDLLDRLGLRPEDFAETLAAKRAEIAARRALWLAERPRVPLAGRSVIVVDDGIATGATVAAALEALGREKPAEIVLAVPVASAEALAMLAPRVGRVVCLSTPEDFGAVGLHYRDFAQVGDDAVAAMLAA